MRSLAMAPGSGVSHVVEHGGDAGGAPGVSRRAGYALRVQGLGDVHWCLPLEGQPKDPLDQRSFFRFNHQDAVFLSSDRHALLQEA